MTIKAAFALKQGEFELDVAFEFPARGVTALFGPSGSGKTTVLRCLAGLERAPRGYLEVDGETWQDSGSFIPPFRRPLGYVFQDVGLFAHLTVHGNLDYARKRTPAGERRLKYDDVVAMLGLSPLLGRSPIKLSGGERQRVAIARALLTSPRLLLMDEPLAALDRASKTEILPYLEQLHGELSIPVLYVSHSPDEVARLADRIVLLEAGKVRAAGPLVDTMTRLDLPLAWGDEAGTVIEARVREHDQDYALTRLTFPGGDIRVPRLDFPEGHSVRLRIHARDVSLTLERQANTSILNIFPARVLDLAEAPPSQAMVRLESGGVPLLARITRRSQALLDIRPGRELYIQVKSVALAG